MKLSEWARHQGISYLTAWRWLRAGKLPVPARQMPTGTILVEAPRPPTCVVLYARVSSYDQKSDLMREVRRLERFAKSQGWKDDEIVAEIGSGLNGKRKKLLRVLRDLCVSPIVVEHRDRLARFGFERIEAALEAAEKRVIVEEGEVITDDRARDLIEILTSAGGRWYGRRAARNRAKRAIEAMGCK